MLSTILHSLAVQEIHCIQSEESNMKKVDNASEIGDDLNDRVYTAVLIHNVVSYTNITDPKAFIGIYNDYTTTPRESLDTVDMGDP